MWVNTAIINWSEWLGFSINLTQNKIDYMLKSIKQFWVIKRPFIWISYVPITPWIKNELNLKSDFWVYIPNQNWSVIEWWPAKIAWIMPWDIITKLNWIKIWIDYDLNLLIQNKLPWEEVLLTVLRWDEEFEVDVILWEN